MVFVLEKRFSRRKLLGARKWFAVNGPADAPPLPLSYDEREDLKCGGSGFQSMVAYYARSLLGQDYAVEAHPSFDDYACGVMALEDVPWYLKDDEELKRRYPPRPLPGLTITALRWEPPVEAKTVQKGRRRQARRSDDCAEVRRSL
jgi:hypothetical protein